MSIGRAIAASHLLTRVACFAAPVFLVESAAGQYCDDWVCFVDETTSRLVLTSDSPNVINVPGESYDPLPDGTDDDNDNPDNLDEADYAWGDADNDGDIDLVAVYKELGSEPGLRRNWFFRNEGGVLVDRTTEFATASTVTLEGGDPSLGFFDLTNDRDVALADVTGDGWLDIITSTTHSGGPEGTIGDKAVSHPRIYVNLGDDPPGSGNWQGFRFDDVDRVPTMPAEPRFCAVSFGDVNNDSYTDLYLTDCSFGMQLPVDINDRLWINDPENPGYFTDESSARMTAEMLASEFAMAGIIADINNDGRPDIAKANSNPPAYVSVSYNNLNGTGADGVFNAYDEPYDESSYHMSTGDLNNDGLLDMLITDNFVDQMSINLGPAGGEVGWATVAIGGSPADYGGNNLIADLDNDTWNDVLIMNMDVDFPDWTCTDRSWIYRNFGGPIGGTPIVAYAGDLNMTEYSLQGGHDVAVFDLDGDKRQDVILGSCHGTFVYINHVPLSVNFTYPNNRPQLLTSGQTTTLEVQVVPVGGGTVVPDSVDLHVSIDGGPFNTFDMTPLGGDLYAAELLALDCPETLNYYISADHNGVVTFTDPADAPTATYHAVAALGTTVQFEDDVESGGLDWTIASDTEMSSGQWEAAVPIGALQEGDIAAPGEDAQPEPGTTMAFVTQNCPDPPAECGGHPAHMADVDGGPTCLISPVLDLDVDAFVTFSAWAFSTGDDSLEVSITNDGNNWVTVSQIESTGASDQDWEAFSFLIGDYVMPSATVQVRFTASDNPNDNVTEAGVDRFLVERLTCDECDLVTCDDGNPCTNDTCESGRCIFTNNSASCDDGNVCRVDEFCQAGACGGGTAVDCSAAGAECMVASCDPDGAEGNCDMIIPGNEGGSCSNGQGICEGGTCSIIDPCTGIAFCADPDGDGRRNDACVWWDCEEGGACVGTDISYGDMGSPNGVCPPDGTADASDRFHALNCFSNQTTLGLPAYNCEDEPPAAFNVDAAGLGAPCTPDGVCDGNDAFAALNAFDGSTTCSCPSGPVPDGPPPAVDSTTMRLAASARQFKPGESVAVHVYLESPLTDLRGYQLHLGVTGGDRGSVALKDIEIQDRSNWIYEGLGAWTAFNVNAGQMVAGLDDPGINTGSRLYLATFVYRASENAAGEFVISLLADEGDSSDRTVLFPTPFNGLIGVDSTRPAVIEVIPSEHRRMGRVGDR